MHVKRAANVIELLEYFAARLRPAPAAAIAEDLGWPRSSTFNLINTLVETGYLHQPQARGGFYPSSRWIVLAQSIAEAELLPEALLASVAEIAAQTGETVIVGVANGIHAVMAHVVESSEPIRYFAKHGDRLPIHSSATGRAILTQYSAADRHALYKRISFERFTPNSLVTADAVEEEIRRGDERGYHLSLGEVTPHLVGVAIPLAIDRRRMAIVVAGPQFRCLDRAQSLATIIRDGLRHLSPPTTDGGQQDESPTLQASRAAAPKRARRAIAGGARVG